MIEFSSLPEIWQTVLVSLLFAALIGELILFICKVSHFAPVKLCLLCGVLLILNMFLLTTLARGYEDIAGRTEMCRLPWAVVAALVVVSALHIAIAFPKEQKRSKACLSPAAIYDAINDLPMGICFADPNGRIILCNNKMRSLAEQLIGGYPQVLAELTDAVKAPPENAALLSEGCLKLENGCIYNFRLTGLTVNGETDWQQLVAQDVTEQYRINEQLDRENEKLKDTNARLQKMYDRMADDIREKESLALKVYVHDTIGRSLLTIQDIMNSGEETEKKLASLREAVSMLSSNRHTFKDTMDEVRQNASKMGVSVKVNGYIPVGTRVESLIVSAARECITNCLRHAHGSEIAVDVREFEGIYKVIITNNGEKPKGKITEGSGLSGLRRSVEESGGEMFVSHYPAFALILNLPGKEFCDD